MEKEKILIMGCQKTMDDICIGCSRCMVGFNRKAGAFDVYKDSDAELIGILGCGGCPGQGVVMRMTQFRTWNAKLQETPTKVHIGPCILQHCPYKETLLEKVRNKAGIEVVDGTHPYLPSDIFA